MCQFVILVFRSFSFTCFKMDRFISIISIYLYRASSSESHVSFAQFLAHMRSEVYPQCTSITSRAQPTALGLMLRRNHFLPFVDSTTMFVALWESTAFLHVDMLGLFTRKSLYLSKSS